MVNPIDLQVNFNQMNQVTKQQALNRESEVLRQDQAASQIQKEGDKDSKDVPDTKNVNEGPGKIKDEEKKRSLKQQNKNDKDQKGEENPEESDKKDKNDKFKDPALGHKIDINV